MYEIIEYHSGLRGSNYYFVVEGNSLVPLSKYASSLIKNRGYIRYTVDPWKIRGKKIIEVNATRSGLVCSGLSYPAEDLPLDYYHRRSEVIPLSHLNNYELAYLTQRDREFFSGDWRYYYIPMIEDIHRIMESVRTPYPPVLPTLLHCQVKSGASYPLSFLIPYSENARWKSLETLTKEIHSDMDYATFNAGSS
ncbi:MAG: hypothetical protein GSR79_00640 [Desulfurococcales archaeon]|nr:hypothetical protein [Desulfurococcales archaeon]